MTHEWTSDGPEPVPDQAPQAPSAGEIVGALAADVATLESIAVAVVGLSRARLVDWSVEPLAMGAARNPTSGGLFRVSWHVEGGHGGVGPRCVRHRRAPGLRFVHGDAHSMPFADQSFDAVVNIESSHCYGDMDRFLAEVHRVLRPGGALLWADLRDRGERLDTVLRQFDSCALELAQQRDVTPEVLHALSLDNARKVALIEAWFPRVVHPLIRPFAGLEGTRNYVRMATGDIRYRSARLLKAAPTAATT